MRGHGAAGMSERGVQPRRPPRRFRQHGSGTVKLWDAATGQPVLTLFGQASLGRGVAFGPDGRCLAAAVGENIKLWDATPPSPELQTIRDAAELVEFLFGQPLPAPEVLDRIRSNPSLDAEVRRRALELAEAHGELLYEEAERVVNGLYERPLLRPEVLASLRADTTLSKPLRRRAPALAEQIPESPSRLNTASLALVARERGAPPEAYRLALMQAVAACQLEPGNGALAEHAGRGPVPLGTLPRGRGHPDAV